MFGAESTSVSAKAAAPVAINANAARDPFIRNRAFIVPPSFRIQPLRPYKFI
jgi:hypothetical protein